MTILKLHASGKQDFIQALKKQLDMLVLKIKNTNVLQKEVKTKALQKARRDFEKAKRNADKSLF